MPRKQFKEHNPEVGGPYDTALQGIPPRESEQQPIQVIAQLPADTPTVPAPPIIVQQRFQPDRIPESEIQQMNQALEYLLAYLPLDASELVREYQLQYGYPLWQIVGGYIMRCRENGDMMSPNILPDWEEMISPNAPRSCDKCNGVMKREIWSQIYCCDACFFDKVDSVGHSATCSIMKG